MTKLAALLVALMMLVSRENIVTVTEPQILFDRAFYHPGETMHAQILVTAGTKVSATISDKSEIIATFESAVRDGKAALEWTPPAAAPRGYGLDIQVTNADGKTVGSLSTAFDVLERWIQAPRYGFLTQFQTGRDDIDETMKWLTRYHVNGLQYYDWQYRHENLMPPTDVYADVLNKEMSLTVVKQLIDAAHGYNIASMPYTAIYGASEAFYETHKDWALYQSPGEPHRLGEHLFVIMDPSQGSPWSIHLLNDFAKVLDNTKFDGIHIDQYGAPKDGIDASGKEVQLDNVFPTFVNDAVDVVHQKRGADGVTIFNLVGNWPVETVAPSKEDAVYIEVWPPDKEFMDLHRIVANAQKLGGGKPVIIAAYIPPERVTNVRLANALIFASGGFYLELGEPGKLLADPYFPKYGTLNEDEKQVLAHYFDFMVRYENVLSLGTTDVTDNRAKALTIADIRTQSLRSRDRVAVIVREGQGFETFNLVNLLGLDHPNWDEPLNSKPTPVSDLHVKVEVSHPVSHVWAASPDDSNLALQAIAFTTDDNAIRFTLPRLDYWSMILVEYAS
ncbi:MAG: hypothetical protein GC179_10890 [Anaerolineaceae bacterium]|nr:hypothetical protein [Anaerolineaceae bacterium]